jgi:hypothetical protein
LVDWWIGRFIVGLEVLPIFQSTNPPILLAQGFHYFIERRLGRTPLVWFGSHGNPFSDVGMLDLLRVAGTLEEINRRYPISLTVISNHRSKFESHFAGWKIPVHYLDWDRVTFLAALRLHDISLIPIGVNDFTRCKSANRLILSLFHGLAVVADDIPSYREFCEVARIADWREGLTAYVADPRVRERDVAGGRLLINERYSLSAIAQHWRQALFPALLPSAHELGAGPGWRC